MVMPPTPTVKPKRGGGDCCKVACSGIVRVIRMKKLCLYSVNWLMIIVGEFFV